MRTWTRAKRDERCGGCGVQIPCGAPMLVIEIVNVSRKRRRCEKCAESPAPPNLPEVVVTTPTFTPMVHIASGPDVLPLKFATVGAEREPGSDDE